MFLKSLHEDEWLPQAQRFPVGSSRRVYHGAESRPNMVIWNNVDSWSAYCHSCRRGAKKTKELVRLVQPQPQKHAKLGMNPGPLTPVGTLGHLRLRAVLEHWQEKGVGWPIVQWAQPHWSEQDKRIVYLLPGGMLGRDLTGKHPAKWFSYQRDMMFGYGRMQPIPGSKVALTEDWYSAAKISTYTEWLGVACLGTSVHPELLAQLIYAEDVALCFDGDNAGRTATADARRVLDLMGKPCRICEVPEGKDPKDLLGEELVCLLQGNPTSTQK